MSTFLDIDDAANELLDEVARKLGCSRAQALTAAIALLAARLKIPVLNDEDT